MHQACGLCTPGGESRFRFPGAAYGILLAVGISGFAAPTGDLLISRSIYAGDSNTVHIGQSLPGGGTAVSDGSYPGVWNNENPDPSFGVTAPIFLDRRALAGNSLTPVNTVTVPTAQIVTSFSSKSELALTLSTDGRHITFMGYAAPVNALDVSNSNTANHVDPTNPVAAIYPRAVGDLDATGASRTVQVTAVDAYSGNNGRAAILDAAGNQYFLVGNAGNGSGTEPVNIVDNTGVQLAVPGAAGETMVVGQQQGTPGSKNGFQFGFSIAQLGLGTDKSGKDDNFRGVAIFGNTLYATKGSGSNGVNTVYQVGSAGVLPTAASASTTPITILPGFSNIIAKSASGVQNPFGLWFADSATLYVADEGDGNAADAATSPEAGLQKWVLAGDGQWHNVYTLQNGLNLGTSYGVPGMPDSLNPATDGLRSLTGRVNGDGTVTLFAATSTVSQAVDQGADPNELVTITDTVALQTAAQAANEQFTVLQTAAFGEVLRGVAFVPLDAPTAVAGSNQMTQVGQTVHLDGSASFAPNTSADSLLYAWSFVSQPGASSAALTGAATEHPSFSANAPGTYVLQLVVTDPHTGLSSAPAQVTVSSVYVPPTADAGPDQSALVGATVTLNGNGSDPSGLSLNYAWSFAARPAGSTASLSAANTADASFRPDRVGSYLLSLTVGDVYGSSAPDTMGVTVITAGDYAQQQIAAAINEAAGLPAADFAAPGLRRAFQVILRGAILALQGGHCDAAKVFLDLAVLRTDGVPLRGHVDTNGPGKDWITAAAAQTAIYRDLEKALGVIGSAACRHR